MGSKPFLQIIIIIIIIIIGVEATIVLELRSTERAEPTFSQRLLLYSKKRVDTKAVKNIEERKNVIWKK